MMFAWTRQGNPADPAADRRRARPLHRRPGRRQARRRRRHPQPLAAAAARRSAAAGRHAQEHHHDRPDRRRQNRDRPPAGQADRRAVHQGRGDQVHRGRLLRPRRREHGPRPGRGRRSAWSSTEQTETVEDEGRARTSRSGCSTCCCPPREATGTPDDDEAKARRERTRDKIRAQLDAGELEDRKVEITVEDEAAPVMILLGQPGHGAWTSTSRACSRRSCPSRRDTRQLTVARGPQGAARAGDRGADRPGQDPPDGDRAGREIGHHLPRRDRQDRRPPTSSTARTCRRQGVQRDLLPIVEGTTVNTKYGPVTTDHILFIAAGAFHGCKPSDLMPELQGRFPIRVELTDLTQDDFVRILTEPQNAPDRSSTARCWRPRGSSSSSPPTPSTRWPRSPSRSTARPRTSAPAGCTRSWSASSRRSASTRPDSPGRRPRDGRLRARAPRQAAIVNRVSMPPTLAWRGRLARVS